MDSGLLRFLRVVTVSEPMKWIAVLGLSLVACGSRDEGRSTPGLEPAPDEPSRSCDQAGQRRCNGADRQVCNQRGGWDLLEACESDAACEATHCNEAACQPSDVGTLRCTGTKWLACTDGMNWQTVEVCDDVLTCCSD